MSRVANDVELIGGPFDGTLIDVLYTDQGPFTDLRMLHPDQNTCLGVLVEHTCWYRLWHHNPTRAHYQPERPTP